MPTVPACGGVVRWFQRGLGRLVGGVGGWAVWVGCVGFERIVEGVEGGALSVDVVGVNVEG
jgi:hypothetical protein